MSIFVTEGQLLFFDNTVDFLSVNQLGNIITDTDQQLVPEIDIVAVAIKSPNYGTKVQCHDIGPEDYGFTANSVLKVEILIRNWRAIIPVIARSVMIKLIEQLKFVVAGLCIDPKLKYGPLWMACGSDEHSPIVPVWHLRI